MNIKEFIDDTVRTLNQDCFAILKGRLIGEYLSFSYIEEEKVNMNIFSEKLYDYFEKLELKTGDDFESILNKYMSNWDEMVGKRIAKEPSDSSISTPRARKHYNHVIEIRKTRNLTNKQFVDYSRIMMCLYATIIKEKNSEICDFEYQIDSLNIDAIISAMKSEIISGLFGIGERNMYDLKELYCCDTSTFILSIIMLCSIKNSAVMGEY